MNDSEIVEKHFSDKGEQTVTEMVKDFTFEEFVGVLIIGFLSTLILLPIILYLLAKLYVG